MKKNKLEGASFLGLTASAISPVLAAVSSIGYLIAQLRGKWPIVVVFFVTNIFILITIKSIVQGDTLGSILPNINKIFTLLFLVVFSKTLNDSLGKTIVSIALLTVPISIVASLLSSRGYFLLEGARTSMVGAFDRLFYPFLEPSHYAIFLALSSIISVAHKRWVSFSVLILGLALTWSLAGWMVFLTLLGFFFYIRFSSSSGSVKVNWLLISFPIMVVTISVFAWLIGESAWLSFKVAQIVGVISGETSLSSVFVRFQSAFLGYEFLKESVQEGDVLGLIFGMPPDQAGSWIKNFYLQKYDIEVLPSSFNAISSMILHLGLVGLGSIFFAIYLFCKKSFAEKKLPYFFVYLVVSFFHGYAFGFLAIFYFVVSMICAREIAR